MSASTFTDTQGRKIAISDLNAVGQFRLVRLVGGENATFFAVCKKLAMIDSIDGKVFPFPRNIIGFEKIIRALGDDGLLALTLHLGEREALRIPDATPPQAPATPEPAAPPELPPQVDVAA